MKKYIVVFMILSLLLYACEQTEENIVDVQNSDIVIETIETFDNNGRGIKVDKSKAVIYDGVIMPEIPKAPPNSYDIAKTLSYQDKWFRTEAVYYPRFTDEIKYEGSEKIKQYYAELAEEQEGYINNISISDEVYDDYFNYHLYTYVTYDVIFFEKYLSVLYFSVGYYGGIHSFDQYWADNFDMTTGEILKLEDLFGYEYMYREILQELICKNLLIQYDEDIFFENPYEVPNIMQNIYDSRFRITEKGIDFIFPTYAIAPYDAGNIFVTVPYEELSEILLMEIGE